MGVPGRELADNRLSVILLADEQLAGEQFEQNLAPRGCPNAAVQIAFLYQMNVGLAAITRGISLDSPYKGNWAHFL